jgi:FtsP/CotA-like multicopper oxidase with cupredoxin domain
MTQPETFRHLPLCASVLVAGVCIPHIHVQAETPSSAVKLPITATLAADSLPNININQNHAPAGELRDSVLRIQLEIAKGQWHPESDDGVALTIYAFGEAGRPLQNPGPLIRVPQGTEVHAALHNTLGFPISVHGLSEPGNDAAVRVASGATEQVRFKATTPGLYFYWGAVEVSDLKLRYGVDAELTVNACRDNDLGNDGTRRPQPNLADSLD